MPDVNPGDIIGYLEMCQREGSQLQRGMNFRLDPRYSVLLMSIRPNAPYADRVENGGKTLVYEGHDEPKSANRPPPKMLDQPLMTPGGKPTQNGLFTAAAERYKRNESPAELVRVYEKIRDGIWTFNGLFELVDAWAETSGVRQVRKFRLHLLTDNIEANKRVDPLPDLLFPHTRLIPPEVKLAVWKRDGGKCVKCGSQTNLHFDHIFPFSRGGSSLTAENIQLLCVRHNLEKRDHVDR